MRKFLHLFSKPAWGDIYLKKGKILNKLYNGRYVYYTFRH